MYLELYWSNIFIIIFIIIMCWNVWTRSECLSEPDPDPGSETSCCIRTAADPQTRFRFRRDPGADQDQCESINRVRLRGWLGSAGGRWSDAAQRETGINPSESGCCCTVRRPGHLQQGPTEQNRFYSFKHTHSTLTGFMHCMTLHGWITEDNPVLSL